MKLFFLLLSGRGQQSRETAPHFKDAYRALAWLLMCPMFLMFFFIMTTAAHCAANAPGMMTKGSGIITGSVVDTHGKPVAGAGWILADGVESYAPIGFNPDRPQAAKLHGQTAWTKHLSAYLQETSHFTLRQVPPGWYCITAEFPLSAVAMRIRVGTNDGKGKCGFSRWTLVRAGRIVHINPIKLDNVVRGGWPTNRAPPCPPQVWIGHFKSSPGGTITGKVINNMTGKPVGGVVVWMDGACGTSGPVWLDGHIFKVDTFSAYTSTHADGAFIFRKVPPGKYIFGCPNRRIAGSGGSHTRGGMWTISGNKAMNVGKIAIK